MLVYCYHWKVSYMCMAAVRDSKERTQQVSVELLCVLAVINLTISPSKSVKAVAYHVLSRFSLFVLDLPASHSSEEQDISTSYHISKPALLLPKLLHHLWSKVIFLSLVHCVCFFLHLLWVCFGITLDDSDYMRIGSPILCSLTNDRRWWCCMIPYVNVVNPVILVLLWLPVHPQKSCFGFLV